MAGTDPLSELRSIKCGRCDDTGWETVDGGRVQRCTGCKAGRPGDAPGIWKDAEGVTLDAYGKTLQVRDENAEAIKHARLFLDGIHQGLYIWGGTGTGKSLLAAAILNTEWKRVGGKAGRFVRSADLMQQLQGQFDDDPERRRDANLLQTQLVNVPLLVLDDVGTEAGTDFSRRTLQDIFDKRTDAGHRTIWTSNYYVDDLAAHLKGDDRLTSRIVGVAKIVELDGVDFRFEQAKARRR